MNNINTVPNTQQTIAPISCTAIPNPVAILFLTLLMTSSATAMLCAAFMTNYWEYVQWDTETLVKLANQTQHVNRIEWMLNGKVARLHKYQAPDHHHPHKTQNHHKNHNRAGVFLVPVYGGIWTLCMDLTADEVRHISADGFARADDCLRYLIDFGEEVETRDWQRPDSASQLHPQIRMQNLAISCSLVCLIILGSAALVGAFGVCQRQLSAILVTGVMYLLAALFAIFTLTIIHFKRYKSHTVLDTDYDTLIDGIVAPKGEAKIAQSLLDARIFMTGWSLELGWGGVVLCTLTSFLWIFLSKLMRFNPLSAMI